MQTGKFITIDGVEGAGKVHKLSLFVIIYKPKALTLS